jgi:hypothetical protein
MVLRSARSSPVPSSRKGNFTSTASFTVILPVVFQMNPVNALTIACRALLMPVTRSLGMHSNKGHSEETNNFSWVKPPS